MSVTTEQQFHALAVAREITGYPDTTDIRLDVMEPPQWWPTMDYTPVKGILAGCGLTRDEARRLLEAMLRDVDEMPEWVQ